MWPTIIILAIVIGLAALALRAVVKQKKSGGCSGCAEGCNCGPSAENHCGK